MLSFVNFFQLLFLSNIRQWAGTFKLCHSTAWWFTRFWESFLVFCLFTAQVGFRVCLLQIWGRYRLHLEGACSSWVACMTTTHDMDRRGWVFQDASTFSRPCVPTIKICVKTNQKEQLHKVAIVNRTVLVRLLKASLQKNVFYVSSLPKRIQWLFGNCMNASNSKQKDVAEVSRGCLVVEPVTGLRDQDPLM